MTEKKVFINRRKSKKRRTDPDPCAALPLDLYHRKRRKSVDRRASNRTLAEDYVAFLGEQEETIHRH